MGTKNNPGAYDCYENAEPDEPMFVLLARDPVAANAVRSWAMQRSVRPGTKDYDQIVEALKCADAMDAWHKENR